PSLDCGPLRETHSAVGMKNGRLTCVHNLICSTNIGESGSLRREPALADLVQQRLVGDAEQPRSPLAIPLRVLEHAVDRLLLRLLRDQPADLAQRDRACGLLEF